MLWSAYNVKLTDINYPIFPIRGHYRVFSEHKIDFVETHLRTWILDNKNLPGPTLAARRFKIQDPYPLKPAIFNLAQLLKYTETPSTGIYIDTLGKIFKYKKTKRHKLVYKKVLKHWVEGTNVVFELKDISSYIHVDVGVLNKYKGFDEQFYLGVIYYHGGWIFYDTSEHKKKDTWKKI